MSAGRIQLSFTRAQAERIKVLADELGCTKGEVIRRALALLQVCQGERRVGYTICVTNGGKIVREIIW